MVISQALTFQKVVNVKCPTSTCIFEDVSFEVVHNVFSFTVHRVRARIFFSFATTFTNLIFCVPISLNLGHLSPLFHKSY